MTSDNIDKSVKNFILSIVPYKYQSGEYVAKGGRILHNIEYQIPAEILKNNPFFAEFRKNDDIKTSKSSKKSSIKMNDFLSSSKYNTITPTLHTKKPTKKTSKSTKKKDDGVYSFDIDKLLFDL